MLCSSPNLLGCILSLCAYKETSFPQKAHSHKLHICLLGIFICFCLFVCMYTDRHELSTFILFDSSCLFSFFFEYSRSIRQNISNRIYCCFNDLRICSTIPFSMRSLEI